MFTEIFFSSALYLLLAKTDFPIEWNKFWGTEKKNGKEEEKRKKSEKEKAEKGNGEKEKKKQGRRIKERDSFLKNHY